MEESESVSIGAANKGIKCVMEESKSLVLKRMINLRVRLETARKAALENFWNLTAEYFTANIIETDLHSENERVIFNDLKTRIEKYKRRLSEEKKLSTNPPSEPKVNQHNGSKPMLRSSVVSEKVGGASKPLEKIAAKRKADGPNLKIKKRPILTIDLTCEDVEEYFPEVVKVNLGYRCDSSAFQESKKCVPSTESNRNEIPVKKRISDAEGVKDDNGISKECGSNHKPALPQPSSAPRKLVDGSSTKFKMIRFDYKKDVGKK